ncbi:hypothetical protein A2V56_00160 [Candidatus Woesebacteria bacterium RBG_19FT_COMBO_42_9]|uniref:EamA domain-containing protein n=1 Tax=Candidatus Woesebacteria bacterium RBG_16_42_24 TaxID=1802485 RepID=A0A1F7XKT3_9BACT|nr:MAG: hypothetical protein A2V97_00965 [Candidatus Woesebacteria bacterium RBG_16_42_24]OGM16646.1 MAG: hypothetical protein A2V56_00160 [Candidatus Woesebacteria bacterium RBG_19FT_COMBO_42_9]OGM68167.1 MAG: hypothetical protein A2985_04060 [Candidatus Woesebacteria bacterium RIFCSPLOWO2_01_FULL_43_11]
MVTWQILIILSVICYSVSVLLQRILVTEKGSDPVAYASFSQLLTGLMIGIFGYLFTSMKYPDFKPLILNFLLMIVLYALGNIFVFKALKKTEASKFSVIFSSRAIIAVLAFSLLMKETLTVSQWIGTLLILSAAVIVSLETKKIKFSFKEIYALLAAMFYGFAVVNDRFLLRHFDVFPYSFLGFVLPALSILAFYSGRIKNMKVFLVKERFVRMATLSLFYAASIILFFYALQITENSSQVISLNSIGVVVTVIFAILFLNERKRIIWKIVGSLLGLLGLLLVK